MTRDEILRRFPNASESLLQANCVLPDSEPRKRQKGMVRSGERETQGPGCRHCRFTLVRKSLLDVDAKHASVKDLLDCLTITHVIRGDKEGQITLEVNQRKVTKGESEHTVIEVYQAKPDNG